MIYETEAEIRFYESVAKLANFDRPGSDSEQAFYEARCHQAPVPCDQRDDLVC